MTRHQHKLGDTGHVYLSQQKTTDADMAEDFACTGQDRYLLKSSTGEGYSDCWMS